jgi:ankyrin repeat protein
MPDHVKDMTDHQSLFRSIEEGVHEIFDVEALKDYVDHGGDVNIKNEFGDTFLHVAVRVGKIEVVRSLLNFSALVDQKNLMMDTPIQVTPL